MTIPSREPPGWSDQCPQCAANVPLEFSALFGETRCAQCGEALWFIYLEPHLRIYRSATSQHLHARVVAFIAQQLNIAPERVAEMTITFEDLGTDSLDTIELVMKLEKELDAP